MMQATALATQHGGQVVTKEAFLELESDDVASVPYTVAIPDGAVHEIVAAKARKGRFNKLAVQAFKSTTLYKDLEEEGYVLHTLKNSLSQLVFESSVAREKSVVDQLKLAIERQKGIRPSGKKLPGGKLMHVVADFRQPARFYVLQTNRPVDVGEEKVGKEGWSIYCALDIVLAETTSKNT